MIWDVKNPKAPMKSINIESTVGYEIAWSKTEEFLFVSSMGAKVLAIDAKNFSIVNADLYEKD